MNIPVRIMAMAATLFATFVVALPEEAAAQNLPGGSWSQSCRNAQLRGDQLYAQCRGRDGNWHNTRIDLDRCGRGGTVGNNNGELVCERLGQGAGNFPPGSWNQSCRNARMEGRDGDTLRAECRTRDGRWIQTRLDTDRCGRNRAVANNNGQLVCESQIGQTGRLPPGPWSQVCRNARVQNNVLYAECPAGGGNWRTVDVNLNRCPGQPITYQNNDLRCPDGQSGGGGYQPWWGQGLPQGSYRQSCRNTRMEGRDLLVAECRRQNGNYRTTRLDIDECRGRDIANDNGHLQCGGRTFGGNYGYQIPGGSWSQSCRNARILRDDLVAECRTVNGNWIPARVDLDECRGRAISNENGRLRC